MDFHLLPTLLAIGFRVDPFGQLSQVYTRNTSLVKGIYGVIGANVGAIREKNQDSARSNLGMYVEARKSWKS